MDTFAASCPSILTWGLPPEQSWATLAIWSKPSAARGQNCLNIYLLDQAILLGGASWMGESAWGCMHSSVFMPLKIGERTVLAL